MGDAKQLRRNFLWNTFGQIIYMVCHFLFGILILSLAGAEQSGIFTTAISATGIFLSIASYGMYNFQVSDAHEKYTQSCYIRSRAYTVALASAVCMVFTLAGVMYGFTGFIEGARIGANTANTGLNYELDAIAACVIGGVSFVGGIGKIRGVIIGVVLLRIIFVGLTFMSVSSNLQYIIKGLIILVACAIDMRKYLVRK